MRPRPRSRPRGSRRGRSTTTRIGAPSTWAAQTCTRPPGVASSAMPPSRLATSWPSPPRTSRPLAVKGPSGPIGLLHLGPGRRPRAGVRRRAPPPPCPRRDQERDRDQRRVLRPGRPARRRTRRCLDARWSTRPGSGRSSARGRSPRARGSWRLPPARGRPCRSGSGSGSPASDAAWPGPVRRTWCRSSGRRRPRRRHRTTRRSTRSRPPRAGPGHGVSPAAT